MTVERALDLAAPPDRVWRAWVSEINRWWTKPYYNDGDRVTALSIEPRLGGAFTEQWGDEGSGFLVGRVVEWLPPQRLAYTWTERRWRGVETLVRLTFTPKGTGTHLTLLHEGFERLAEPHVMHQGYAQGVMELTERLRVYVDG